MTGHGMMRLLACSDIHGSFSVVERILARERDHDVLIIAGDLTTRGTIGEATDALRRLSAMTPRLLAIGGNMDDASFDDRFNAMGIGLNARGVLVEDVGFFGVAGCPFTPMKTPNEISEEEIARRCEEGWRSVPQARRMVFVPHTPPARTALDRILVGAHVGSTAVREFTERRKPDVLICGHIHEARGIETLGSTTMVNCGPASRGSYAIIEIGERIMVELKG